VDSCWWSGKPPATGPGISEGDVPSGRDCTSRGSNGGCTIFGGKAHAARSNRYDQDYSWKTSGQGACLDVLDFFSAAAASVTATASSGSKATRPHRQVASWHWPYWALLLLFVSLVVGGILVYQIEESSARRKVQDNLDVVSSLKVAQIVQWRQELLGNAEDLASQPYLADTVARWLERPDDSDLAAIMISLRIVQRRAKLNDAMIVDATGQLRLNLLGHQNILDNTDHEPLAAVLRTRRPTLTGLHPHRENAEAHVDAIVPLVASDGRVAGAVILETEAADFLYPMLARWPIASGSAETLLVRRTGESVEFLNATRHRPDAAMRLRIPLSRSEVPAVRAALGQQGIFEGIDYRGEPVLSVLRPIPDSLWFLVTKMDTAEAYADWYARSQLLLLLMATLTLATLAGLLWLSRSAASYRELSNAEAELRDQQSHLEELVAQRTLELEERNATLAAEINERKSAESGLQAANHRLADLTTEQAKHLRDLAGELTRAEQRERERLQERLHDEVQPLLVAARLALSGISAGSCTATCVGIATDAREHIGKVLATARDLSTELSPPLLRERGLVPALEALVRLMATNYGLAVDFAYDPDAEPADLATRLLCFNTARELLMNVVKHAGISSAELNLQLEQPNLLRVSAVDAGTGFIADTTAAMGGSGLLGLQRRLKMIGGQLNIDSQPGKGTTVIVHIPFEPTVEAHSPGGMT
jgi:signal transduction histidine kinase